MLNYIKSELYRMTHSSALYIAGIAFAATPALTNILLYCFARLNPNFPYATTSYSYSNTVAIPMIFSVAALFLVLVLYEGNKKNGNLKNVVAAGISREKIFLGQIVVCLTASLAVLVFTIIAYIFSARLLLKIQGPVTEKDLLMAAFAMAPIAIASLILGIIAVNYFNRLSMGMIWWLCIFFFIPELLYYSALIIYIPLIQKIAMWMPLNFLKSMQVNQRICSPFWNTPDGLAKCLISGFAGIVIFIIVGLWSLRKKEL